ncbi:MAG: hypothetical protein GYB65_17225 [Chloroflexi bacterium]|nr:hypothetical protein [Chloroflexota bacterium]
MIRKLLVVFVVALVVLPVVPGLAQDDGIVSAVNDDIITRDEFHARVQFVRWQYLKELEALYELTAGNMGIAPTYVLALVDNLENPELLGDAVLTQMEDELLLWRTGESMGVTPTAEDAAEREAQFFSLWTEIPVDELAENDVAQQFISEWYAGATEASGLSEDDLRYLFATEALRDMLYQTLGEEISPTELAVNTRHILCAWHPDNLASLAEPTPDERAAADACIADAQAQLAEGVPFADVARELSDDPGSAPVGGDLDWSFLSYLVENYAAAVETAELDTLIGPVETEFGLHLIEVLDREERELSPAQLEEARAGYFDLWLLELRLDSSAERSDDWAEGLPTSPGLDSLDPEIQAAIERVRAN